MGALKLLALASSFYFGEYAHASAIQVSSTPPVNASAPLLEAFVSYSIEFAFFPDFAGIFSPKQQISLHI
jgi:hypothetical protein